MNETLLHLKTTLSFTMSQAIISFDTYYSHLYALARAELHYVLDPKEVYGDDFPGGTFRAMKERN